MFVYMNHTRNIYIRSRFGTSHLGTNIAHFPLALPHVTAVVGTTHETPWGPRPSNKKHVVNRQTIGDRYNRCS